MPSESSSSRAAIQALVVECLDLLEESGPAAVDQFLQRHPDAAEAVQERLDQLRARGLLEEPSGREFPDRLGDFRLFERIGGGGMGVVFRAEQVALKREVALKLIRPERLFFPGARERFRREVEVVARLAHPNIVPVYTVGDDHDLPYFAMERITGASLAELLRTLSGQRPERLGSDDLTSALRSLTGASQAVARPGTWIEIVVGLTNEIAAALTHAHSRGVLHRDVKPSNIMLATDGRVLLTDFGLASSAGGDAITQTGSVFGSLPYMSPEQLRGQEPDERSDVYSLGVTLYELLALTPPYVETNIELLRARILAGEYPRLRARNRTVPWDVEVVCSKALACEPAQRYADAASFARDLGHLLARRPIEARRASTWLRLRRWAQRRPARAVAVVAGTLLLTVAPVTWALVERSASQRVEAGLDLALESIDSMLGRFGDRDVARLPIMRSLQLELLQDAHRLLDELAVLRPAARDLPFEIARLEAAMSQVHLDLGQPTEALHWAERHIAAFDEAPADLVPPATREHELTRGWNGIGNLRLALGDPWGAITAYERAIESATAHRRRTNDAAVWTRVSIAQRNLARVLLDLGELERARVTIADAVRTARLACTDSADGLEARRTLARALNLQSLGFERLGSPRALAVSEEAVAVLEQVARLAPDDTSIQRDRIEVGTGHAVRLVAAGRSGEADALFERVLGIARELAARQPDVADHRRWVGIVQANRASKASMDGRSDLARALADESVAVLAELCEAYPNVTEHAVDLAQVLTSSAAIHTTAGEYDAGAVDVARAIDLARAVLASGGSNVLVEETLKKALLTRANLEQFAREYRTAERTLLEARDLPQFDPDFHRMTGELWVDCANWASEDFALATAERRRLTEHYLDEAQRAFEVAFDSGFADSARLRANPALWRLLERPAFQALLHTVESVE